MKFSCSLKAWPAGAVSLCNASASAPLQVIPVAGPGMTGNDNGYVITGSPGCFRSIRPRLAMLNRCDPHGRRTSGSKYGAAGAAGTGYARVGRTPENFRNIIAGIDQKVKIDAGLDAEPVQHVEQVFTGDI